MNERDLNIIISLIKSGGAYCADSGYFRCMKEECIISSAIYKTGKYPDIHDVLCGKEGPRKLVEMAKQELYNVDPELLFKLLI